MNATTTVDRRAEAALLLGALGAAFLSFQAWGPVAAVVAAVVAGLVGMHSGLPLPLALAASTAWAMSRTTGLPFGPEPGAPEAVGIPDVVSVMLELVTAGACAWALLAPRWRLAGLGTPVRALGLAGAVAVTAWALGTVGTA